MSQVSQAAKIRIANDFDPDGTGTQTANEFGVKKIAVTSAHNVATLPASWSGRYVKIRPVGGNVHFAVSASSTAEVDSSVAANTAGASTKVGAYLPDGEAGHYQLPAWDPKTYPNMYLVHEGSASLTLYVELT